MQASVLLLRWGSYRRALNLRVLIVYLFFSPCYVALCASKARHRFSSEKVSWCLETSLFLRFPSRDGTPSLPERETLNGFLEFLTYKESEFDIKREFLWAFHVFSLMFVKGFNLRILISF